MDQKLEIRKQLHKKELSIKKEEFEKAKLSLVYAIKIFNNKWSDLTMDDLDNDRMEKLTKDISTLEDLKFDMVSKKMQASLAEINDVVDGLEY